MNNRLPIIKKTSISENPNTPKCEKWQMSKVSRERNIAVPVSQKGGDRIEDGGREPIPSRKVGENTH